MAQRPMSLAEYKRFYINQNPNDKVDKPKAIGFQWGILIPFFIGLIAVNVLSAFHTGPLIAGLYDTDVSGIAFVMGVLGVEFTVFVLMFVPFTDNKRETILRVLVIVAAILVSVIANVNATIIHLQAKDDASQIAAGIVGIFAPLANLAMAEVLRIMRERQRKEREGFEDTYKADLKKWDADMGNRYRAYLKKLGVTDPTVIMQLSNGDEVAPELIVRQSEVQESSPSKPKQAIVAPPRVLRLAEQLKQNGDTELSFSAIQSKYGVYPADISKAKSYLRDNPQ